MLFPSPCLPPSLPLVICLILMSCCFVLMPSFSSHLLSYPSSRSFCSSLILRHSFSLYLVIFLLPISLSNCDVYREVSIKALEDFLPLHTIYELFSFLFYLRERCVVQWMECDTDAVGSFHCLTKQAEQVICACGSHVLCELTHTAFGFILLILWKHFTSNMTETWRKMLFSVSRGSVSTCFPCFLQYLKWSLHAVPLGGCLGYLSTRCWSVICLDTWSGSGTSAC